MHQSTEIPKTQMELLAAFNLLEVIHREFDRAAGELESHLAVPLCVRCGHCCQRMTPISWNIEGQFALSCVMGNGSLAKIADCCESWLLDRQPGISTYGLPSGRIGQDTYQNRLVAEIDKLINSRCPLLAEDNTCLMYQSRSISCRAYGVTRQSGKDCSRPYGTGETDGTRAYWGGCGATDLQNQLTVYLRSLRRPEWKISWFLPTLMMYLIRPGKFKSYTESNKIASAKLVIGKVSPSIIWQNQLQELWRRNKKS